MKTSAPRNWQTAVLVMVVVGLLILALSGYLNSMVRTLMNPLIGVQGWFSTRYMAVYELFTVPKDVSTLRSQNSLLENEVSQLQAQVIQLQQQLRESEVLYSLLDFARANPDNEYVAAAVIGRDTSPFMHYVYIDKGSDQGIRHGMPVVTQQGLVGRVEAVSAGASRVQIINDPSAAVNIRMQSTQINALLSGSVTGDLNLEMIPQDVTIQPGEVILSSGLGGNYPADILIGQILTVRRNENELFQTASVQPAVDFNTLRAVLVIKNFHPVDIQPLAPSTVP